MLQRKQFSLTCLDIPSPETGAGDLLVMLHGYGSNEKDLIQLAPWLDRDLHFISARAPVQIDDDMYGWFPIAFTPEGITVDREAALRAREALSGFLRQLVAEYRPPEDRVWLMGFSQGAVMSYLTALAEPSLLHGVIALSGQFPDPAMQETPDPEALRDTPFLIVHGLYDNVLPVSNGRKADRWLTGRIDDLTYREYPMGHEISPDAIGLVNNWLAARRNTE